MSTEDNLNAQPSVIKQMETVLVEKEEIINKKLEELNTTKTALAEFEAKLVQKVNELKSQQEKFEQEKADFKAEVEAENEKIKAKWDEIRAYEEKLKISTDEVLAEKLNFERMQKERLEQEIDSAPAGSSISNLNLSELGALVGIDVDALPVTDSVSKVPEEPLVETVSAVQKTESEIPDLFMNFQTAAERMFSGPKNYVIEITKEHFCMQIGDKELRLFNKEPLPEVHIVVNRKNAKSDSKLQKKFPLLARTIPDWTFETEANHLICKMYFTNQTNTELVLTKCKDCIEKIDEL